MSGELVGDNTNIVLRTAVIATCVNLCFVTGSAVGAGVKFADCAKVCHRSTGS